MKNKYVFMTLEEFRKAFFATPPEVRDVAESIIADDGEFGVKYTYGNDSILLTEAEYQNWLAKRKVLRNGKQLMFEGAKFGDRYLTRGNKVAIFQCELTDCVSVFTEDSSPSIHFDGTSFLCDSEYDIVQKLEN